MRGKGESVARLIRPGATYPWLYRKSVPFQVAGTSMRYWAAPMLPVAEVVVEDGLGVGLGAGRALVEGAHAMSESTATARNAVLTEMKRQRRDSNSDVGPGLTTVNGDACTVEKACLL